MHIRVWGVNPRLDQSLVDELGAWASSHGVVIDVEYIDVLTDGDRAMDEDVRATPTLEKVDPPPRRVLVAGRPPDSAVSELLGG